MSDLISLPTIPLEAISMGNKIDKLERSLESGEPNRSGGSSPKLKEACSELESLFIYYLLKEMRATIPKTGLISGGRAEEIYTSMLDSQLSKEMAAQRGIGLSSLILDRLEDRPRQVNGKNVQKSEEKT